MSKTKINGKEILNIGYPQGPIIGLVIEVVSVYRGQNKRQILHLLKRVLENPSFYRDHKKLSPVAMALIDHLNKSQCKELEPKSKAFKVYGRSGIEMGAINQMDQAMKLSVAVSGALMADAHHGYGLPIGGVLATRDSIIPYGVGVDIGCRMSLSIYDMAPSLLAQKTHEYKSILIDNTKFGRATFDRPLDDPIMDRREFGLMPILKSLKDTAHKQIGSSGGGNHFVEFGIVNISEEDKDLKVPSGRYIGVLSHSGSRGMGAKIAQHYTRLAKEICHLPKEVQHLAWLDMNSAEGQEYWIAMNLAGDYASACHNHIHQRISKAIGETPIVSVENHHNFAWKELDTDGNELIVHRKGATPAGRGVLGIIPGSMTADGYIVKGKGNAESLSSASHGAGRAMSRSKAKTSLSKKDVSKFIKDSGVSLIGAGLDEAPMAYKDINKVMSNQEDLIHILGSFTPKIVRMCGDEKMLGIDS